MSTSALFRGVPPLWSVVGAAGSDGDVLTYDATARVVSMQPVPPAPEPFVETDNRFVDFSESGGSGLFGITTYDAFLGESGGTLNQITIATNNVAASNPLVPLTGGTTKLVSTNISPEFRPPNNINVGVTNVVDTAGVKPCTIKINTSGSIELNLISGTFAAGAATIERFSVVYPAPKL